MVSKKTGVFKAWNKKISFLEIKKPFNSAFFLFFEFETLLPKI